jgi:hypothetical protein
MHKCYWEIQKEKEEALHQKFIGKTIKKIDVCEDFINFEFTDTYFCLKIADKGQECCESRYITCDDDTSHFIGATYQGYELLEAPPGEGDDPDDDRCHECQFLVINTSTGSFRCVTHNEHNGYYGGFNIEIESIP